jgi:GH25 family lysozyme M1 (1,4-beta-N-acetylmuramidase)
LAQAKNPWFFKQLDKRHPMDKSMGNFLFGPSAEGAEAKPVYYVKEVFFPDFLTASSDGRRLWIATYTGLLRLDQTGK